MCTSLDCRCPSTPQMPLDCLTETHKMNHSTIMDVLTSLHTHNPMISDADLEATDTLGYTALHSACSSGHVSTTRLLIKRGANVKARTNEGFAPFDLAKPELVCMLFDAEERSPTGLGETLGQRLAAEDGAPAGVCGGGGGGMAGGAVEGAVAAARRRTSSGGTPRAGARPSSGGAAAGVGGMLRTPHGTPPISPAGVAGAGAGVGGGLLSNAASPLEFGRRPPRTSTSSGSIPTPDILSGGSTNRTPPAGGRHFAASLAAASGGGDEASPRAPTPPTVVLPNGVMKRLSAQKSQHAGPLLFGASGGGGGGGAAGSGCDQAQWAIDQGQQEAAAAVEDGGASRAQRHRPRPAQVDSPTVAAGERPERGAQLSDIMSAFTQDDQDIVMRFQELRLQQQDAGAGAGAAGAAGGGSASAVARSAAEDAAAALDAVAAAGGIGEAAHAWLRSMLPAPAFAPPGAATSPGGAEASPQQQQQQAAFHYDIPSVPRFGFGSDLGASSCDEASQRSFPGVAGGAGDGHRQQHAHQQQDQQQPLGAGAHQQQQQRQLQDFALHTSLRQLEERQGDPHKRQEAQQRDGQSRQQQVRPRGQQHQQEADVEGGDDQQQPQGSHLQQQQQQQQRADEAVVSPAAAAAAPRIQRQETLDAREREPHERDGMCALLEACCSSGDLPGAGAPPPLERAESPAQSRLSAAGGFGAVTAVGSGGFGGAGLEDVRSPIDKEGVRDPQKLGQAAEALADVVSGASAEAIGLRAAVMFGHSMELQTGTMQWTRGELLGGFGVLGCVAGVWLVCWFGVGGWIVLV